MREKNKGFTLIEMLVVIAIIGVLATIVMTVAKNGRDKAADSRIKNDIRQMRWLAEIVYNAQGEDFTNWSSNSDIVSDFNILKADIEDAYGAADTVSVGETETSNFCVSAPLVTNANRYYCVDASREIRISDGPCPSVSTPHLCP